MSEFNSGIAVEVFNAKTLKVEWKAVDLKAFIEWFNLLGDEDIKNLGLTKKAYKTVRRLIESGRLAKTYNPSVYDFVLAYIQHPTLNLKRLTFNL